MFVDASAIVAIVTLEEDADPLAEAIEGASSAITSGIAVYEAVLAICRKTRSSVSDAQKVVGDFIQTTQIEVVAITHADAALALDAFSRYGKGRGHPARLNMGDCFAYAIARSRGARLLYKGDDFSRTDIVAA